MSPGADHAPPFDRIVFDCDSTLSSIEGIEELSGEHLDEIARLTRAGVLDVIDRDFVRTARAKGLSEARVQIRHVLRNAMLAVVTYFGPLLAILLTGSFVLLGLAFWATRRPRLSGDGAACPTRAGRVARLVLWIASAVWLGAAVLQFIVPVYGV